MELHAEYMASSKSGLSFENINYYNAEDSGYHTSFTPGSFERSDVLSHSLDQSLPAYVSTPTSNIRQPRRYDPLRARNDATTDTPPRGTKRPHPNSEIMKQTTTIPTPTTLIVGKIESLGVHEDKENTTIYHPPVSPHSAKSSRKYIYRLKVSEQILNKSIYPITPVKKNCKTSLCRSAKKLDFADFTIHSLSCKQHELQAVPEEHTRVQIRQPSLARPNQKIDIISLLHEACAIPVFKNILQYLNNEDSHSFCCVSDSWYQIWNLYSSKEKKVAKIKYLKTAKKNQENCLESINKEEGNKVRSGCFKDINYQVVENIPSNGLVSPPRSPRSNRFRKFTKSASLDSRLQLSCVRCSQPAKVTEEKTGEEWVECTNTTCAYQFCRACNCSRHPGKSCSQYDLNAPSPSKRKKCEYAVGTFKSRKNLRRLL